MSKALKSKKSLIILIPMVLLVWGLIVVRAFKLVKGPETAIKQSVSFAPDEDTLIMQSLKKPALSYRDPFMAQVIEDPNLPEAQSLFYTNPEPKETPVNWPELSYQGVVANGVKRFAIVQQGKQRLILAQQSELSPGFIIRDFYNDSLIISTNNKSKTYYKEKR